MGDTGFDHSHDPKRNTENFNTGNVNSSVDEIGSASLAGNLAGDDSSLARLLAAWPRLSTEDRARLADEAERLTVEPSVQHD